MPELRIRVELSDEEQKIGLACGEARARNATGRKAKNGMPDGESDFNHKLGVLGEIAVAKYFNLYFDPKTDIFKSKPDVGPFGVRTNTTMGERYLWFYSDDPLDQPQILVWCREGVYSNEFWLCGFEIARNGLAVKRPNIWRSDRPNFFYLLENELQPIGPELTPYLRHYFRRRYSALSLLRAQHE